MEDGQYLTIEEIAKRFEVNPTTVYRLAQSGRLPGFKIGGQWRFEERSLERWIADRTGTQPLGRSESIKEVFVATVSHELRTPLTIVQEGVSQLAEGLLGDMTQEQRQSLTIVLRNVDRLRRLIDDLLDISALEAGKIRLQKEWVNLKDLLQPVVAAIEPRVKEKNLQLKVHLSSSPSKIFADGERVVQIFNRLVENAVRFTEEGFIEISLQSRENEVACVISDTGIGIAEGDFPKLFDKFQQFGRIEGGGFRGTGLGLAIAKKLIELHGGAIRVESAPGKGTTVTFTLPKLSAQVSRAGI